jgi:hypothetical protein
MPAAGPIAGARTGSPVVTVTLLWRTFFTVSPLPRMLPLARTGGARVHEKQYAIARGF